jgi:zinc transporter, ZIP family
MTGALTSAGWGAIAAGATVAGALIAIWLDPGRRLVALVMAFGAGALVSAAAYELVLDAAHAGDAWLIMFGLLLGALAFYAGDRLLDRRGGAARKRMSADAQASSGQALFLGALLDGVPESAILGMTLATSGGIGLAFLAAVFMSNVPEAMSSTSIMRAAGWTSGRILSQWLLLVAACAASAVLGYFIVATIPAAEGVFAQAFAAGAIIAMLANTMLPEAVREGGKEVGLLTVCGFAVAALLAGLEAGH